MTTLIERLYGCKQSIWIDNLSRSMVTPQNGEDCELSRLISQGVRGLTSNPTIFKNSIVGSEHYHQAVATLASRGQTAEEIVTTLMCEDVAKAAKLLLPTYHASGGRDGFASIEVSPLLANTTELTIKEAVRLWERIGLPNVMIKIPATKEGLPAITEVLARGINVDVTLIFSRERYSEVWRAFIEGVSRLANGGEVGVEGGVPPHAIGSVASFFVSRLDAILEARAEGHPEIKPILGKAAIANCHLVYDSFEKLAAQSDFQHLEQQGAGVQRPLWASTGVKNPTYDPLYYVHALVAAETVNTLPSATLERLLAHKSSPNVPLEELSRRDKIQSQEVLAKLAEAGLDLEHLCSELEVAGVKSFVDSYASLVGAVEDAVKGHATPVG